MVRAFKKSNGKKKSKDAYKNSKTNFGEEDLEIEEDKVEMITNINKERMRVYPV